MAESEGLNVREAVERKLIALGVDADDVNVRTLRHLELIEKAVQAEEERLKQAKATVRGRGFVLSAISAASGVSRATFYNKPLLAEYVALSRSEAVGDIDATASRAELAAANAKVRRLMERDGALVLALADNERLAKRIEALEAALEDVRRHFEGTPRGRVVPFGKDVR